MTPLLLIVGAESGTRQAMADELSSRFARDYAIETCAAASHALDRLRACTAEGPPVAMVLAGITGDGDDGIGLLTHVRGVVPTAVRIAFHRRSDRDAMRATRQAEALGRIDSGLPVPTGARDEHFFTVLTEYLADWAWIAGTVSAAVVIVGDAASAEVRTMVDVVERHGVPTGVHAPDSDEGRRILAGVHDPVLPVVQVLDQPPLAAPSLAVVADQFGFVPGVTTTVFDLAIVGGGPAGLGAAVSAASEGLSTLVVEREAAGGQAATSAMIRNYLGFPRGLAGRQLAFRGIAQATRFGAGFHLMRAVEALARRDGLMRLSLSSGDVVSARTVLLACGVVYRRLGVPGLEDLVGAGVFYGAATGAAHALGGLDAVVVGAGNSAGQAALHVARYASHVTLAVRGPDLERSMSDYLIQEIRTHDRITVRTHTEVVDGGGDGHLQWLTLQDDTTGSRTDVPAAGLFILIGAVPRTGWLPPEIERDAREFVRTGAEITADRWPLERAPGAFETSLPGVFAAGDVRAGSIKRVAAAAGEGAVTVPMVHHVLTAATSG